MSQLPRNLLSDAILASKPTCPGWSLDVLLVAFDSTLADKAGSSRLQTPFRGKCQTRSRVRFAAEPGVQFHGIERSHRLTW